MRWLLGGVVLGVAGLSVPAWADCAGEIAAIEDELAATPAGGAGGAQEPASSPEEVVDQMIEEGVSVEEDGADARFAAGGLAEPRESWTSTDSPEEHPAVVHLASAKQQLDAGDQAGCTDAVAQARAALGEE
jgi:hypothetical protein